LSGMNENLDCQRGVHRNIPHLGKPREYAISRGSRSGRLANGVVR
jgi:hypothetical protein